MTDLNADLMLADSVLSSSQHLGLSTIITTELFSHLVGFQVAHLECAQMHKALLDPRPLMNGNADKCELLEIRR